MKIGSLFIIPGEVYVSVVYKYEVGHKGLMVSGSLSWRGVTLEINLERVLMLDLAVGEEEIFYCKE